MLMVIDVLLCHFHLSSANTGAHVAHTIIITDGRMLVIGISVTGLSSIPHNLIFIFRILTNQGSSTRCSDHFVAIETQHTKTAKGTQHSTVETRSKSLCRILYHRNTIPIGNRHNLIYLIRHSIKSHRHNRLRITPRLFLAVEDGLLQ